MAKALEKLPADRFESAGAVSQKVGESRWTVLSAKIALSLLTRAILEAPSITRCTDRDCDRCRDAIAGGPVPYQKEYLYDILQGVRVRCARCEHRLPSEKARPPQLRSLSSSVSKGDSNDLLAIKAAFNLTCSTDRTSRFRRR